MLGMIASVLVIYAASILLKPLLHYFRDENGLRKYPGENSLSGISGIGHNWELGRKHKIFHTNRLHDKLMKETVIRVAPKWLFFGKSRAVQATSEDIHCVLSTTVIAFRRLIAPFQQF